MNPLPRIFAVIAAPLWTVAIACGDPPAPSSAPATQVAEPQLWAEMQAVDAHADHIADVSADFRQEKFTPLLKKPLVSTGKVVGRGSSALWTTQQPEPTQMLVTPAEIRIFYPQQHQVEVYPLQGQLGMLASSPLPRLATLKQFFRFQRLAAASLDPGANDRDQLALQLTPIDSSLAEHVQDVRVLLDRNSGLVLRAETTDPDGERTVLSFTHITTNQNVPESALRLNLPAGTTVVHPLEGLDAPAGGGQ